MGTTAKKIWTTNEQNAVASLESKGDIEVISQALGERHKVRSFFNNIWFAASSTTSLTQTPGVRRE